MSRRRPKPRRSSLSPPVSVTVTGIGGRGDGLAATEDGTRLYIPLTLPGDQVEVRPGARRGDGVAAELVRVFEPGPDRITPPCSHFGTCGGCSLQHWRPEAVADWKRLLVAEACGRRGLDLEPETTRSVPPGTRRRVSLRWVLAGGKVLLGFNARDSDRVVDIKTCPLLVPPLTDLLDPLRQLIGELENRDRQGAVQATLCDNGIDLTIFNNVSLDLNDREILSRFSQAQDLARLNWSASTQQDPEPVSQQREPLVTFGGLPLAIAPGAFLQPSRIGEALLRDLVLEGVGDGRKVADLYAGYGTFSLPLAAGRQVMSLESNPVAVAAARMAAGRGGRGGNLMATVRDLDRQPLSGKELEGLDALVFDPPRAGAAAQAAEIAASSIPRLVAVSCHPATLARDLRLLVDGGYRLDRVVPVDQFTWSAHVEAVAFLHKDG
ncbi:class I SAM-dependent RNA methyltransferase [Magnetospira sp. QH-2]|uniref:class I SAM-dependent RNA methyltransferase n=1 Tax=Magnetospira sp. (strain QH-2) TaxID=1288970 RepID=UPI0003E81089|nr:class I SAM-dependent RNA methyltransferase [Magnetospira sp. QH-2]CCQ74968.1 putative RNA methyltransferase [Magnetospira sp. QH-2]